MQRDKEIVTEPESFTIYFAFPCVISIVHSRWAQVPLGSFGEAKNLGNAERSIRIGLLLGLKLSQELGQVKYEMMFLTPVFYA